LVILLIIAALILLRPEYLRFEAQRSGVAHSLEALNVAFEESEVTNERYGYCVQAGRCPEPDRLRSTYSLSGTARLPVTGIDVFAANTFCRWIGRRLPTNREWELASTNGSTTTFPWGSQTPSADTAVLKEENILATPTAPRSVSALPHSKSNAGLFDLVGNVWELTRTLYDRDKIGSDWAGVEIPQVTFVVARGGSYQVTSTGLGGLNGFLPVSMSSEREDIGFRCVE
jgi:formylglycine-generating enzyme required for sulfatase activity